MSNGNVTRLPGAPEPKGSGTGGSDGGIEARLRSVEQRLIKVETLLESAATKEDIQSLKTDMEKNANSQLKWGIGILFAALATALAVMNFIGGG